MPFDVPWFIGGGAEHSAEVARLLTYIGSQGAEGVVGIGDLAVKADTSASGRVRVLPGACVIRNRAAGGGYQSYACRLPVTDYVTITPTGSTGRSDLIVARVENPFMSGESYAKPVVGSTAESDGPYCYPRAIPNVGSGVRDIREVPGRANESAITLARVDIPPNTTAITQGMIVPLRDMANPRSKLRMFGHSLISSESQTLVASGDAGQYWPGLYIFKVDVPTWAARASVRFEWSQVLFPGGSAAGRIWGRFGTDSVPDMFDTQRAVWDTTGTAGSSRSSLSVTDDVAIPASMRGTNVTLTMRAQIGVGYFAAARPVLDGGSSIACIVNFIESAAEDASA